MKYTIQLILFLLCLILFLSCAPTSSKVVKQTPTKPGDVFNLNFWKLTLPLDDDNNGKVDEVKVADLYRYQHSDFFYLDDNGFLVFTAPNKAKTSANSTNTRSELRQMFRGKNTKIGTHDPKNNFALKAHPFSKKYADVGGQLEATLRVLHVATRAKNPDKWAAFSVVVGQIHALKNSTLTKKKGGFGWGNEPLKIFYKKWPNHKTGSVFWTYELNLPKDDPNRTDIAYAVWGNTWENPEDPGENGIALGELFNYNVNVHNNIMYLTFRTADPKRTVTYQIDLSNNIDPYGQVIANDNPQGYAGDSFYFKAGAYNQCSTLEADDFRFPGCPGTGVWAEDKANGDYTSVAFKRITLSRAVAPLQ